MKTKQVVELIEAKRELISAQARFDGLAKLFKEAGVASYAHKTGFVVVSQKTGRKTPDQAKLAQVLPPEILETCYKRGADYLQLDVSPN